MSTRNWFRIHRKQVATHSLIIAGFLVFTVFFAEPLFDRLERIPGEAELHRFELPYETEGMRSYIDALETKDSIMVEVRGWAFIEGEDSEGNDIYVVLRSGRRTYIFDTMVRMRPDATQHFEELGLNLDYSGFNALLPTRNVADGEYTVGIYIRKGDIEVLQYTDRTITRSGGIVETGWVREGEDM